MPDFMFDHIEHVLCALILASRIGDIGTTYLVTPTMVLEANPVARKLGWPFAVLTLAVCFVPYFSTGAGVMILVPSLMVSAANAGRVWVTRAIGEHEYHVFLLRVAAVGKLRTAIVCVLLSSMFIVLLGGLLILFYPDGTEEYGYWFGAGIILYGLVVAVHGSLSFIRLFKQVAASTAR